MFNVSGGEIVVILLLALVILGPEKLPEALRRAGRTYAELKKMGNSFQTEMRSVLDEPMKEMRDTADLLRQAVDVTVETATTDTRTPPKPTSTARPEAVAAPPDAAPPDAAAAPTPPEPAIVEPAPARPAPASADSPADDTMPTRPPPVDRPSAPGSADDLINRTLAGEP